MNRSIRYCLIVFFCLLPLIGQTHQTSDSFLVIDASQGNTVSINWSIPLRDLEVEPGLDMDGDAKVTRAEFESRIPLITAYALERLSLQSDQSACSIKVDRITAGARAGQAVAVIDATADCPSLDSLTLAYSLFFDIDDSHRGLLRTITTTGESASVLSPTRPTASISADGSGRAGLISFVRSGIHHILIGYDHIAFLIVLLLPAALRRRGGEWTLVTEPRRIIFDVIGIVTAFTVAHSLTLGLAATGIIRLPVQIAEALIALSVVAAALANFAQTTMRQRQYLAFGFGLVHGFGFASVFADLGVVSTQLVSILFAFNIGVELGQLAIVILLLPLIVLLSRRRLYQNVGLPLASASAMLLGFVWLLQRI